MNKPYQTYIDNLKHITPLQQKTPLRKNWNLEPPPDISILDKHVGNFGWVLGPLDVVLDIDKRNGGYESAKKIKQYLPDFPCVETPNEGYHFYFKLKTKVELKKTLKDLPGIDMLTEGHNCVIVGSENNNKLYKWYHKCDGFHQHEMPDELIEIYSKPKHEDNHNPLEDELILSVPESQVIAALKNLSPSMPNDNWVRVGMALHNWHRERGLVLWEQWSRGGDNYRKGETSKRWASFKNDGGVTIKSILKFSNIKTQKKKKTIHKPIETKDEDWISQWVWVNSHSMFANIHFDALYSMTSFNLIAAKKIIEIYNTSMVPSAFVVRNGLVTVVTSIQYLPHIKEKIIDYGTHKVLNGFNPESLPTPPADYTEEGKLAVNFIVNHIKMLCGEDHEIFLNWMSFIIQNPGKKLCWLPLIISIPGTGKSFLVELFGKMLGRVNIGVVSPHDISDNFNGWAIGKILNFVEELKVDGHNRYEVINKLKPLITDSNIRINEKSVKAYEAINITNYVAFSNSDRPVPIDEHDRRWFIIKCPINSIGDLEKKVGMNNIFYFKKLWGLCLENADQILLWLGSRDIPDTFKDLQRAPMNLAKQELIDEENDNNTGYIECEEALDGVDEVNVNDFYNQITLNHDHLRGNIFSTSKLRYILKKLGFVYKVRRVIDDKHKRFLSRKK